VAEHPEEGIVHWREAVEQKIDGAYGVAEVSRIEHRAELW
jgi:hypothetical protein